MITISPLNCFSYQFSVVAEELDFSSFPSYVDRQPYIEAFNNGDYLVIPDAPIIAPLPDWDGLLNRLLSGNLYPLFKSITNAAFSNPVLLVARNDIYGAISNPAIIDRISALKAGLDMLLASGYEVSPEDKNLWNTAIAELNFPDEVKL